VIPAVEVGEARIFLGDCREILRGLADNSVDSVVTDPPYELGFMGKKWDSTGIAYDVTVWEECLRVLKPGGHILAFGGSRTFHRMAVAIEDAGFEIRDSIAWMYGSGFPKSLDVSKAIDKRRDDSKEAAKVAKYLLSYNKFETLSGFRQHLNIKIIGEEHSGGSAQGWTTVSPNTVTKARVPKWEQWLELKELLGLGEEMDAEVWRLNGRKGTPGEAWENRVVTGIHTASAAHQVWMANYSDHVALPPKEMKNAAHTAEAQQWQGWGTALKPAFEPIVVGRKPFAKGSTVAANVLEHGVGGLNIDGSRIGTEIITSHGAQTDGGGEESVKGSVFGNGTRDYVTPARQGRWPANVILDEYSAGLLDEQSGVLTSGALKPWVNGSVASKTVASFSAGLDGKTRDYTADKSSGGASRFFYCAKASKRDRNEGLDGLEDISSKRYGDMAAGELPQQTARSERISKNFHPTVKPTSLMRYLIKLVTFPGGTVLDPFTGSGSTGKAALLDGYKFVGAELTEEYLPIIEGRLKWAQENTDTGTLL